MPKTETTYYCEVCDMPHSTFESAVECERRHVIPTKFEARYDRWENDGLYPGRIHVKFSNGVEKDYYYDSE